MERLDSPFEQQIFKFPAEENLQESLGNLPNSLESEFSQIQNAANFILILLKISQGSQWRDQFVDLSSRYSNYLEDGIFEESKGNLKDSCSPRFSLCHNSKF